MNRQEAENIITEYLKPIFGFALKRCKNEQDAEDLSQEIVFRAFRALLVKDDIEDAGKFIWAIAHNTLSNYYRDTAKNTVGVPLDDVAETLTDPDAFGEDDECEAIRRLQSEIAYLSKLQRRIIIAYYFENRKQAEIAKELDIPLGTVKWHLFEAKKELKRGMSTMRKTSELKFNPIRFCAVGINGSSGSKSATDYLRSALAQNICYCVRNQAKSVNEIADDLGVSPVFVESEIEALEEFGLLCSRKDGYIVNFIISEPEAELLKLKDSMYKRAASLFANDLFDELTSSGLLDDPDIWCGQTDDAISLTESPRGDHNFLLWALIPFIAARSGEALMDESIKFEEVATIRPDGGHNIVHATVVDDNIKLPKDYVHMRNWCGPMWGGNRNYCLWQIDSEWSDRGEHHGYILADETQRVLSLFDREIEAGVLSRDEYAFLAERGYVKTNGDYEGKFKSAWQIVVLANNEIKNKLLSVGEKLKIKYRETFDEIKKPYVAAVLDSVPAHMRKVKEYELQFVFHSDGWFLLHCIVALLNNGKMHPPTEGQRKALTTLIFPN